LIFFSLFDILHIYFSTSDIFNSSPQISYNTRNIESSQAGFKTLEFPLKPEMLASAIKYRFEVPQGILLISEVEFDNGKYKNFDRV